ncbi:MAG: dTDP-4-dehydrorhamnose 3,5-epimerase [Nitrospira sp.]|nr:dTDP-4-dehydrorhamnose 3,5-epimerase [Nitrospira sp.]MDH4242844.1 dTDP-4-dehydrorhamnose 3,5-epimerase [Nitrospira sp.]MDH4355903.1 dTDP-4-dehydrorhamnose 3,5-epimerase [Nitrospira sp.]MDH5317882.1 dTDP-4-dehydrorhamnose 3,5-epimerase [Nitrospira sp.]
MRFTETALNGAFVIDLEPIGDERGLFARTWCRKEFEAHGLVATWVQSSISVNNRKGTMRGMHYQDAPNEEVKLVCCTAGAIYDVIVDLRPTSPTYCQHVGVTLSADNHRAVYIPKQFAHGFLTLEDKSEVSYHMSEFYSPASARGFRWDDPAFKIAWPEPILVISEKDRTWPAFTMNVPS